MFTQTEAKKQYTCFHFPPQRACIFSGAPTCAPSLVRFAVEFRFSAMPVPKGGLSGIMRRRITAVVRDAPEGEDYGVEDVYNVLVSRHREYSRLGPVRKSNLRSATPTLQQAVSLSVRRQC